MVFFKSMTYKEMDMRVLIVLAVILAGCGESRDMYELGYGDGFASGYNTTCKIRGTLIEGAWDDKEYSEGYRAGYADGATDCTSGKKY